MTGCCVHVTEKMVRNKTVSTSLKLCQHFVVGLRWPTRRSRWRQPVARIFNDTAFVWGRDRDKKGDNLGLKSMYRFWTEPRVFYLGCREREHWGTDNVCVCVCFQRHNQYRCKNVNRNTDIVRHCLVEHLETGIGQVTSFGGIVRQPQYFVSKKNYKKKVITWLFCVTMNTNLSASIFSLRLLESWRRVTC